MKKYALALAALIAATGLSLADDAPKADNGEKTVPHVDAPPPPKPLDLKAEVPHITVQDLIDLQTAARLAGREEARQELAQNQQAAAKAQEVSAKVMKQLQPEPAPAK